MTHRYAAIQLLRLGPLSASEFREITGWRFRVAHNVLGELRSAGVIRCVKRGVYQLVETRA
jgi:hypothetical protein